MRLYYVRHGEPVYDPDSLTEKGEEQAEALKWIFQRHKVGKIFTSTSTRAIQTAKPTAEMLGITPVSYDWAHESNIARTFWINNERGNTWMHWHPQYISLFERPDVLSLGTKWYESPIPDIAKLKEGALTFIHGQDAWLETLGYHHDHEHDRYVAPDPYDGDVAFFAHGGCGMIFLATILDIPYPIMARTFQEHVHTGVTVIEFGKGEYVHPRLLSFNATPHLAAIDMANQFNF